MCEIQCWYAEEVEKEGSKRLKKCGATDFVLDEIMRHLATNCARNERL